ncbi:MAG TPA: hypothetical protein VF184_06275 [Phycisphaeraceae bacterium]
MTAHPYRFRGAERSRAGYVRLDRRWAATLDDSCGPCTRMAAEDLHALMAKTFGQPLRKRAAGAAGIVFVRVGSGEGEAYELEVTENRINIEAQSDEGGMRALFHLGRRMLEARAPLLELGRWSRRPRWALRITSPLLHRMRDTPQDYLDLPDAYLLNMARYGYNATYLYMDWFDYMTPAVAGPLARPGAKERLRDLERAARHLGRFGIRLLFHINTLALPSEHRLFKISPAMRGAQTWHKGLHCLCSSSPEVLKLYRDAAGQLFAEAPSLAGAVLIVGGECFLHCYTRPVPKPEGATNCPRCRRRAPEEVIAGVVNSFVEGALAAQPGARVLVWPYSAFTWGDLAAQKRLLASMDRRAASLVAFEKDQWLTIEGVRSYVYDYAISQLGPSPRFRALHRESRRTGHQSWAKTEASNAIEMFHVPRIPIMHRWAQRYEALCSAGVDGVHTAWRFYGFCAQRTDEVVDYYAWEPRPDGEAFLHRLAQRDFGPAAAGAVVKAWRCFSDAFAKFPYAAGVNGFPYFRGPFVLGPAHPFVFDLNQPIRLSDRFWAVDPSLEEAVSDPEQVSAQRQPRFFLDLTWTQPFGPERVERRLREIERGWQLGLRLLQEAGRGLSGQQRQAWQEEWDLARTIGAMFHTALNLVRFQRLREQVTSNACHADRVRRACRQALMLLQDELDHAQAILPVLQRDPALGYGATYGRGFDADLVAEKIDHTRYQIEHVLPTFFSIYMFHAFGCNEELHAPAAQRL